MPRKPSRPCKYPGCPHLASDERIGYCDTHLKQSQRQYDQQRGTSTQRGYNYRWQKASKLYLAGHPLCAICLKKNPPVIKAAECVDHIIPHKGDYKLFWDPANHQPACLECNRIKAAKEEGAFGNPVDKEKDDGVGGIKV